MYAENLKIIRKKLDISAAKLAKKLNVSQGSIMQYEHGIRTPNYNFMYQLNNILNINLNWFVTGEGEMFIDSIKYSEQSQQKLEQTIIKLLKKNGISN